MAVMESIISSVMPRKDTEEIDGKVHCLDFLDCFMFNFADVLDKTAIKRKNDSAMIEENIACSR